MGLPVHRSRIKPGTSEYADWRADGLVSRSRLNLGRVTSCSDIFVGFLSPSKWIPRYGPASMLRTEWDVNCYTHVGLLLWRKSLRGPTAEKLILKWLVQWHSKSNEPSTFLLFWINYKAERKGFAQRSHTFLWQPRDQHMALLSVGKCRHLNAYG
jgi:hypothetical protein